MAGFVDVHSHVVPSGDDGSRTIEQGLALCRLAVEAGTEILFATPHVHAPWDSYPWTPGREEVYLRSLAEMQAEVAEWGLDLRRGWEVYPSEVATRDPSDFVLDGTRGVLVEFPGSWLEIEDSIAVVTEAVVGVEAAGLVPVLAHPERNRAVAAKPECVRPLVERGALLCLNAPSVLGVHGSTAESTAWMLLDLGLIHLAASDAHSDSRPPTLDAAYDLVRERLGDAAARRLFDGSALPWV
jgi:protein-tyrosine phosphatase